jgi:hypothetical protein
MIRRREFITLLGCAAGGMAAQAGQFGGQHDSVPRCRSKCDNNDRVRPRC